MTLLDSSSYPHNIGMPGSALHAGRLNLGDNGGDGGGDSLQDAALRDVTRALAPHKPTTHMLIEGARAGGISVEAAWAIYVAMLNASQG